MANVTRHGRGLLLCCGCGYDLSGLAVDGQCPECAVSIATSRANLLSGRSFPLLCAVHRGAILVELALIGGAVEAVLALQAGMGWWIIERYSPTWALFCATLLLISIAHAIGWWWMTRPEITLNRAVVARHAARWSAVLIATSVVGALTFQTQLIGALFVASGFVTLFAHGIAAIAWTHELASMLDDSARHPRPPVQSGVLLYLALSASLLVVAPVILTGPIEAWRIIAPLGALTVLVCAGWAGILHLRSLDGIRVRLAALRRGATRG